MFKKDTLISDAIWYAKKNKHTFEVKFILTIVAVAIISMFIGIILHLLGIDQW